MMLQDADSLRHGSSISHKYSAARPGAVFDLSERWHSIENWGEVDARAYKYFLRYCHDENLTEDEQHALAHLVMRGCFPLPSKLEIIRGRCLVHTGARPAYCARFFREITGVGEIVYPSTSARLRSMAYTEKFDLPYLERNEPAGANYELWLLPTGQLVYCGMDCRVISLDEDSFSFFQGSSPAIAEVIESYDLTEVRVPALGPPIRPNADVCSTSLVCVPSEDELSSPAVSTSINELSECCQLTDDSIDDDLVPVSHPYFDPPYLPNSPFCRPEIEEELKTVWASECKVIRSLLGSGDFYAFAVDKIRRVICAADHPGGISGLIRTSGYNLVKGSFFLDPDVATSTASERVPPILNRGIPPLPPRAVAAIVFLDDFGSVVIVRNSKSEYSLPLFYKLKGYNNELDDFNFGLWANLSLSPEVNTRFARHHFAGFDVLVGIIILSSASSIVVRDKSITVVVEPIDAFLKSRILVPSHAIIRKIARSPGYYDCLARYDLVPPNSSISFSGGGCPQFNGAFCPENIS